MKKNQQVLENEKKKGKSTMKNKEKQNCTNQSQDEFLFYPLNSYITEDVATQKIITWANALLDISEDDPPTDYKITIGYRALNKLLFSDTLNKAENLNRVPNVIKYVSEKSIEDIAYCVQNEFQFVEYPHMYFNTEFDKTEYKNTESFAEDASFFVSRLTENADAQKFLSNLKRKFDLSNLIAEENQYLVEDFKKLPLINFYFKFDFKYKNKKIADSSTMKVVCQFATEYGASTYSWNYNLKLFLAGKAKPKFTSHYDSIKNLINY